MATTYTLISSNVLSSSAASVTFSSIPSTYTDLVIRASANMGTISQSSQRLYMQFNGDTGSATTYSWTTVYNDGTVSGSQRLSNTYAVDEIWGGSRATSTFGSSEIYIPNYTVSTNKPVGVFAVPEANAANLSQGLTAVAGLWRNTAAITSIALTANGSFQSGSSFYLYGIKNS